MRRWHFLLGLMAIASSDAKPCTFSLPSLTDHLLITERSVVPPNLVLASFREDFGPWRVVIDHESGVIPSRTETFDGRAGLDGQVELAPNEAFHLRFFQGDQESEALSVTLTTLSDPDEIIPAPPVVTIESEYRPGQLSYRECVPEPGFVFDEARTIHRLVLETIPDEVVAIRFSAQHEGAPRASFVDAPQNIALSLLEAERWSVTMSFIDWAGNESEPTNFDVELGPTGGCQSAGAPFGIALLGLVLSRRAKRRLHVNRRVQL